MRAYVAVSPGVAEFREIVMPRPDEDEILIRVKRAGICGTDLAIFSGDCSFVRDGSITYPVRFGHEWSGVVEAVGTKVRGFAPGDRVIADNAVACGKCEYCRAGNYDECRSIRSVGTVQCYDGCFADYMLMPERHVFHLPDPISFDTAALLEPLSVALQAFTSAQDGQGKFAGIVGTGAIGLSSLCLARHFGYRTAVIGRKKKKLAVAQEMGADYVINNTLEDASARIRELTGGKGADLMIETSGSQEGLLQAIYATAKSGTISVVGFFEKPIDGIPLDHIVFNDLVLRGAAGKFGSVAKVRDILEKDPMPLEKMITHRVKFADCAEQFAHADEYKAERIKTMIEFD